MSESKKIILVFLVFLVFLVATILGTCILNMIPTADAATPTLEANHISYGMPAKYPVNVKSMTDEQFFQWATIWNLVAANAWEVEAAKSPRYINARVLVTKSKARILASGNSQSSANGYTILPNNTQGSATSKTYEYTRQYANPNYSWPGPLTIINPYVRPK